MPARSEILSGLRETADTLDALICDIWGVLHAGGAIFPEAVHALTQFRRHRGPVVLLSNAPRTVATVAAQLVERGLPEGAHDSIVTSGGIARGLIRSQWRGALLYHLGPESDCDLTANLPVSFVDSIRSATCLLVSGPTAAEAGTDDDVLKAAKQGGLDMICANPDMYVMNTGRRIACAGILASRYEAMGGRVHRTGKPEAIAFDVALHSLTEANGAPVDPARVLVVGDGLETDIKGAKQAGLRCLHILSGQPGEQRSPDRTADYSLDRLCW